MKIDKTYLISGSAVLAALIFFGYTKYKKSKLVENTTNTPDVSSQDLQETQQTEIPINLSTILAKPLSQINVELKGKSIATKLSNVNARQSAKVNDGLINNLYGPIPTRGTFVGKVTSVVEDVNKAKNANGKVYKWLKVTLSDDAIREINSIDRPYHYYTPYLGGLYPGYFREDTIILI